jgi:large subunit ribosomal protein L17
MRHRVDHRKLGRDSAARHALLMNLARALIFNEEIKTTYPKAKEAQRYIDKLVARSKTGGFNSVRLVIKDLRDKKAVKKLFREIAPKFKDTNGGFTRVVKLPFRRRGDGAEMAILQFSYVGTEAAVESENKKAPQVVYKAKNKEEKSE